MDDLEKKGANESGSPTDEKGAKEAGSPTAEELRKAQGVAEVLRKELDDVRDEMKSNKTELEKLREKDELTTAEKKRAAMLAAGITDDESLVSELEGMIAKGDQTARAYNRLIEKRAREIAKEEVKKELTASQLERDFDRRDEILETEHAKWNEGKDKDTRVTLSKFTEMVGEYSDPAIAGRPVDQLKGALRLWRRELDLSERESKLKSEKDKDGNFRDPGTAGAGETDKKKTPHWRDAKTPQEKDAQLATL